MAEIEAMRTRKSIAKWCAMALSCCAALGQAATAQDVVSDLRGHWKLTETRGPRANDSAPTPHHGTYANGVTLAASSPVPVDDAVAAMFDGVNDYVAISTESYFDATGPCTVAAWIKADDYDNDPQVIVGKGSGAWRLLLDRAAGGATFAATGLSAVSVTSTSDIFDGAWHHVVGVYTGSALEIYIDGVRENAVASSGAIATNNIPVEIGRNSEAPGREFDGAIYDVRVYYRGLSTVDVSYLYLQGGPVGHWRLADGSGATPADASLYARDGSVSGASNWSTRCNGEETLDFTGASNYVRVPNAPHLRPTAALSMAAWIRGDSWGSGTDVDAIIRKGEDNPNNYQLAIADRRVALMLNASDNGGVRGNTVLQAGQWYHVAATWDGATVRIYVNGKLDNAPASRTGTIPVDARPLYVGGRAGADYFDGMIHDARLYNRAITAAEVAKVHGLTGHWRFDEGSGLAAADSSGAASNVTLAGATWVTDCGGRAALYTNGAGGVARTDAPFEPPAKGAVAFWMQGAGNPAALSRMFGLGGDWEVRQQPDGTLVFDLCGEGGGNFATLDPVSDPGRWRHVVATFDSADDSFAIYLDGMLHRSGVNSNAMRQQPAGVLSFGVRTGTSAYWKGALRDFRVYDRRLCSDEIADLAGIAAHWKLDETGGSIAADSSGWGRDGLVSGTPMWTAGRVDNGLQLNGSTYVAAPGLMGAPRNVTLMAWAQLTAADAGGAEVISLGDCFAIRLDEAGQSKAVFFNGSSRTAAAVNQTFAGAGWRHFVAVFDDDGNSCKFYVNGVEVASTTTAASIRYTGLGPDTVIGRHGNGSLNYDFTGKVDDVRVYSRALCPEEILQAFNDGGGAVRGVRIMKWVETR